MAEINLLPIDLSPNSGSAKSANVIKKISIILVVIFIIFALAGGAGIFFFTNQINGINQDSNFLTQKITSLEDTEQKLFLVKDRIDKIKLANSQGDVITIGETLNKAVSNLPSNVSIGTVSVDAEKTTFSIISKDSLGMATFLNSIIASGLYKNLSMTSFLFIPDSGYTITLSSMNS